MMALMSLLGSAAASGCDTGPDTTATDAPLASPEKQFVFEQARLEHRQEGKLVWTAHAKRTDGDLTQAVATDVRMQRQPQTADQDAYDIESPSALLNMDSGKADFENVRITDAFGGLITAGNAHYDEGVARIDVDGPVAFSAKGLVAHATRGTIDLTSGTFDIVGPVQGRFDPTSAPKSP